MNVQINVDNQDFPAPNIYKIPTLYTPTVCYAGEKTWP
jgi:hypothetical protein